jgi:hypothetical protein
MAWRRAALRKTRGQQSGQRPRQGAPQFGYQARDEHIIDYKLEKLTPRFWVRGPKPPLERGTYFVCMGAAQTFGRFCERPYPTILSEELGLPVLNLSAAGAGPLFFLRRPGLLRHANRARFVVVQIMSGRSEKNSLFDSGRGTSVLTRRSDGSKLIAELAFRELIKTSPEEVVRKVVAETRSNWLTHCSELLARIEVPKILFWFSLRTPDYEEDYSHVYRLLGYHPHLINAEMVENLKPQADDYVECVTSRGFPQPLYDRSGARTTYVGPDKLGSPVHTENSAYPSPEMHEDGAAALLGPARALLARELRSPARK